MSNELANYLYEIGTIADKIEETLKMAFNGMINQDEASVKSAENNIISLKMTSKMLTSEIIKNHDKFNPAEKEILIPMSIITQIERIFESSNNLFKAFNIKIKDKISFSDFAISEIKEIFQLVCKILSSLKDAFAKRNPATIKSIQNNTQVVTKKVDSSAEGHEKRLLDGVCKPGSTYVFLDVLYALKAIAWHANESLKKLPDSK